VFLISLVAEVLLLNYFYFYFYHFIETYVKPNNLIYGKVVVAGFSRFIAGIIIYFVIIAT